MIAIDNRATVIGLIAIAVSQSATAGTTIRDHRGQSGNQVVATTGARPAT
jgi:hypothetical protein